MVTKADLDASGWQEVVAGCQRREVRDFANAFIRKAIEAEKAGNESDFGAFRFLAQVCSLLLVDDDSGEVFRPTVVLASGRSLSVEDVTANDVAVLEALLPEVKEPELAARIGDVLWVAGRRHQAARAAVEAYLESAGNLEDPDQWPATAERLKRAVHLAASLGRGGSALFEKASAAVEAVLDKYQGTDRSFLSAELMELLQDYGRGDPAKYEAFAEAAALRAEAEPNFTKARAYWKVKARWHATAKDSEQETASRKNYAQTFVAEADREIARETPSFFRAAGYLRAAVESYRRIPSGKADADRLRERLEEYQSQGMAELKPIEIKFDPTPMIEAAERAVEGKPFPEVLFTLATMGCSPSVRWLKENAKKNVSLAERLNLRGARFFLSIRSAIWIFSQSSIRRPSCRLVERESSEGAWPPDSEAISSSQLISSFLNSKIRSVKSFTGKGFELRRSTTKVFSRRRRSVSSLMRLRSFLVRIWPLIWKGFCLTNSGPI